MMEQFLYKKYVPWLHDKVFHTLNKVGHVTGLPNTYGGWWQYEDEPVYVGISGDWGGQNHLVVIGYRPPDWKRMSPYFEEPRAKDIKDNFKFQLYDPTVRTR